MKVLIATPAYGGLVTCDYVNSVVALILKFQSIGVDSVHRMIGNESLVPRARNNLATYALNEGFDKLLFIDADLRFTPDDVLRLFIGPHIVGGTYPLKNYPITLNYNAIDPEAKPDATGLLEVAHVPTGLLLINKCVLKLLSHHVRKYSTFAADTGATAEVFEFFPSGATADGRYLSEDWAFCELASEHGYPIYLQTKSVADHIGSHRFSVHSTPEVL